MTNYEKIYASIGNECMASLLRAIENRNGYKDTPEYHEMITQFHDLLGQIQDQDLKENIGESSVGCTSVAMYQGFVLGFREAVQLLTGGLKK